MMRKTTNNVGPSEEFLTNLSEVLIPLRRFALALCRHNQEADDLTQNTCERALSRWSQFDDGTRMDSWTFSIMHSIWKNQLRKSSNRKRVYDEISKNELQHDGERHLMGKIALSEVLLALETLNNNQRAAITLVCINGLSYKEAAQILEVPQGTLESRIGRGRIALGQVLNEQNSEKQNVVRLTKSQAPTRLRKYDEAN